MTRRLVHAGTGLFVVATPYLFAEVWPLYLLAASFVAVNGIAAWRGWLRGMHPADRPSWGTAAFPLALLLVLPFTWQPERQFILQMAFLILAFADPVAASIGERATRRAPHRGETSKTWLGSAAFFITAGPLCAAALILFAPQAQRPALPELLLLSLLVASTTTAVEALGGRGWDNLFIVITAVVQLLVWWQDPATLVTMSWGVLAGVLFAIVSWRLQFLTPSGALAGGLFGASLVGLGGWGWIVPAMAFFVLSSLLSRITPRLERGATRSAPRRSRRDATQVYANGGVAWLLLITYALAPHPLLYWGFVGSLAAATADTWATEVGPLFRQDPRIILSGRPVPRGTSGAVSPGGTLAGIVGALVIWGVAWMTTFEAAREAGWWMSLMAVVGGGVMGSLADSFAGAAVQAVYLDARSGRLVDEGITEDDPGVRLVRGWRWIDNNLVNLLCTLVGGAVAIAILAMSWL